MKTKNLIAAVLLILSVGFASCKDEDVIPHNAECGIFNFTEAEFVSWCIVPNVVSRNSVNMMRIENHTQKTLSFGTSFSLEYFNKNEWIPIQLHGAMWEKILLGFLSGEVSERYTDLYSFVKKYNNAKKGKYRVVRQYDLNNFPNDFLDIFTLYAEFIVK